MRFNYVMLGYILKQKRVDKGLSKNKLAQLVGISQPEVTRIENGIRTVPNILTLINMCEILDIDFINLLKVTGFVDRKNLLEKGFYDMKIYKVTAKKTKEIELEVEAENEENAMEIVQDFIDSVDVFNVKIPKGIQNNEKIRLMGQGKEGKNGGKNGDLIINIQINDTSKFKLDGLNLKTSVNISPWEAALSTNLTVTGIDDDVTINIPRKPNSSLIIENIKSV